MSVGVGHHSRIESLPIEMQQKILQRLSDTDLVAYAERTSKRLTNDLQPLLAKTASQNR